MKLGDTGIDLRKNHALIFLLIVKTKIFMGRVWGILVLVIDVLAILDVLKSDREIEKKILWIVVILLLPLLGALAWYGVSRKIINL